jgi:hypothetical protein
MRKGGGVSRRTKPAPAGAGMSEQRTLKRSAAERSEAEAHQNKKGSPPKETASKNTIQAYSLISFKVVCWLLRRSWMR